MTNTHSSMASMSGLKPPTYGVALQVGGFSPDKEPRTTFYNV